MLFAFVLIAAAVDAGQARTVPVPAPLQDRVGAAIVEALVQRMGADARIIVEQLEIASVRDVTPIEAVPEPGARTGEVVAFALLGSVGQGASRRVINVGRATALVRVEAPHVKADPADYPWQGRRRRRSADRRRGRARRAAAPPADVRPAAGRTRPEEYRRG